MRTLIAVFALCAMIVASSRVSGQGTHVPPCTNAQMAAVAELLEDHDIVRKHDRMLDQIERTGATNFRAVTRALEDLITDWVEDVQPRLPECMLADLLDNAFFRTTNERLVASLYIELGVAELSARRTSNADEFIDRMTSHNEEAILWMNFWQGYVLIVDLANGGS